MNEKFVMTGAEAVIITETTPLFRIPAFRLMFATRLTSHMANHFLAIAIAWQIWKMTESPLHLGLVGLAQFLPPLLLSLVAGQIADRYDRRIILRCSYILQSVMAAVFLLLTLFEPPLAAIYTALTINAMARAFEGPSLQALLPVMVPRQVLGRAIALQSSTNKVSQLIGPPLAGALLAVSGPGVDYLGCLLLSLVALGAMLLMPSPLTPFRPSKGGLNAVLDGFRFIWRSPPILGAISLDLVATFFGGITALLPIFADEILKIGPMGFGILRSAPGVGGLLTALVLTHYPIQRHGGKMLFGTLAVYGSTTLAFGLSENVVLSVALLVLVGAADMVNTIIRQTFVQVNIPDEMRGRVAAVSSVSVLTGGQLGQFRAGLAADWFGAVGSVVIGGAAVVLMVGIWAGLFPALRRMQKPDEVQPVHGRLATQD
jgi:MFS family permease